MPYGVETHLMSRHDGKSQWNYLSKMDALWLWPPFSLCVLRPLYYFRTLHALTFFWPNVIRFSFSLFTSLCWGYLNCRKKPSISLNMYKSLLLDVMYVCCTILFFFFRAFSSNAFNFKSVHFKFYRYLISSIQHCTLFCTRNLGNQDKTAEFNVFNQRYKYKWRIFLCPRDFSLVSTKQLDKIATCQYFELSQCYRSRQLPRNSHLILFYVFRLILCFTWPQPQSVHVKQFKRID